MPDDKLVRRDVTVFLRLGVTFAGVVAGDVAGCVARAMAKAETLSAMDMFRATPDAKRRMSEAAAADVVYADAVEVAGAMAEDEFGAAGDAVWYDARGFKEEVL